jgi:hypothetical protein
MVIRKKRAASRWLGALGGTPETGRPDVVEPPATDPRAIRTARSLSSPRVPEMPASIQFAEDEDKRDDEKLIALVVGGMQDPVTPVLEAAFAREGLYDAGRMIARLSEVVHHGAAAIYENLPSIRAVEINLRHHVQPP